VTPVVRSFVSIPAGVFEMPLAPYTLFTLIGSALWAFAFAGIGYAVGSNYERFHHFFDLALVAGAALLVLYLVGSGEPLDSDPGPVPDIPLVDVKAQYERLIPQIRERMHEVLESGIFILGPNVEAFEQEAADYLGVPRTVSVANGTDALVLALDAWTIGPATRSSARRLRSTRPRRRLRAAARLRSSPTSTPSR
jgi:hypothetical protein